MKLLRDNPSPINDPNPVFYSAGVCKYGQFCRFNHPKSEAQKYPLELNVLGLPKRSVWRNCAKDYTTPVSIWRPRLPQCYVSAGCVAMSSFTEPEPDLVYCMAESIAEETTFEEQQVWSAPDSYPWTCCIYQVRSPALHFVALRQPRDEAAWKPMRVIDDTSRPSVSLLSEASSSTSGH